MPPTATTVTTPKRSRSSSTPRRPPYRDLLEFFFQIHDPTTKDRQGNDRGPSYRSAIFYTSDAQKRIAEDTIADVKASGSGPARWSPRWLSCGDFWEAEPEHQDYLERYPNGYTCHFVRPAGSAASSRHPERLTRPSGASPSTSKFSPPIPAQKGLPSPARATPLSWRRAGYGPGDMEPPQRFDQVAVEPVLAADTVRPLRRGLLVPAGGLGSSRPTVDAGPATGPCSSCSDSWSSTWRSSPRWPR